MDTSRITFTKKRPPGADLKGENRTVLLDGNPIGFLDAGSASGKKCCNLAHFGAGFWWVQTSDVALEIMTRLTEKGLV